VKFWIAFSLLSCAAWAADITPLNVKLGEWETSINAQIAGLPPIPQNVLDKMTPEQRAMMESRMKANQNRPVVTKTCLKQEDLEKASAFGADDKSCTRTILKSSRTEQEMRMECSRNGGKQNGTIHVEALDSGHVKGVVRMSMEQNDRTMTINSNFEAKWLGSTCSEKDDK
jgi:hypothetical protein